MADIGLDSSLTSKPNQRQGNQGNICYLKYNKKNLINSHPPKGECSNTLRNDKSIQDKETSGTEMVGFITNLLLLRSCAQYLEHDVIRLLSGVARILVGWLETRFNSRFPRSKISTNI